MNRTMSADNAKTYIKGTRKGMKARDGPKRYVMKWLGPMFFAMFGFYLQSVGLHFATYSYVHKILSVPKQQQMSLNDTVLPDPFEAWMGPVENVSIQSLDSFALCFPLLFVVLSSIKYEQTLQVWTKVMICAGFLFALKGLMGAVTTVPDAGGFQVCIDRLKGAGLEWMREEHSLSEMFILDFQWVFKYHQPLRYCSDMMYSGHTFSVTLAALGCYEQLRIVWPPTEHIEGKQPLRPLILKASALILLSGAAILEQCLEIYFVLRSHFHYTSDVLMALLLTFLFYTNGAIAVFSKQWEVLGFGVFLAGGNRKVDRTKFPFNKFKWLMNLFPTSDLMTEKDWQATEAWISKGDIFTPPCCVPFCFSAGRQHMYSDNGVIEMLNVAFREKEVTEEVFKERVQALVKEMNLSEGIDMSQFKQMIGSDMNNRDSMKRGLLDHSDKV